ncbi:MAG: ECF transporter S component [Bacillota bacterium]|nr:ECF transporter S component [Candidatus Fermentithermobacillaceae bacterium]HOP71215.1 ECF transporter S component [Bacillota bacterium]HPT36014.1 ECF transporter S component [Bacillota bacterium]HPZ85505.1 ECF transporter S component [Bacillota bacterium]HQD86116.1 ECF transporter S component [Bacillota bacterium]
MKLSTRKITSIGLLGALTVALGFMPVGGFIPVPTPAGSATTMHIPTILAGVLEGPVAGAIVGAIFGGFSFWRAQTNPNPVAKLMFSNPLIAFLPRVLIGVVSHYVYKLARGTSGRALLMFVTAAALGHTGYWSFAGKPSAWRWLFALLLGGIGVAVIVLVNRKSTNQGPALAAVSGSIANTVGVMGLSVLFKYVPAEAAVAVGITHGIPEALVAMVLTDLIYRGTRSFR